jgi:HTH-type transcriptional regulator/antitoxin HigA
MDIKPIKTEADHRAALVEIERLFDATPGTSEGDRLEIWITLVQAYEAQHYPIPQPGPVEAILYHMESRGLSRSDLEPYLGSRAWAAEVLNRKRALSMEMIRRLHTGLGIAAAVLIQPYTIQTSAKLRAVTERPSTRYKAARSQSKNKRTNT